MGPLVVASPGGQLDRGLGRHRGTTSARCAMTESDNRAGLTRFMKTVSAAETVAMILDGATLMIGGCRGAGSPKDMVWIPGGSFHMRRDQGCDQQGAMVQAFVTGFWMDRTPVTVRRFSEFVAATGHVTRPESAVDDAGPGSFVFIGAESRSAISGRCWAFSRQANWRSSKCVGVPDQPFDDNRPAVHVTYQDAEAYAAWVHKALPTGAEWEFAAQGGFGLQGLTNGIWEWTADWYIPGAAGDLPKSCCVPECPGNETSANSQSLFIPRKLLKGGSCFRRGACGLRYDGRTHAQPIDAAADHIGFRCVTGAAGPV